jgi:four helix bundle protein
MFSRSQKCSVKRSEKTQTPKGQRPKKKPINEKPRDLEERTAGFAVAIRAFVRGLPRTIANIEDVKQLVRASGSVAANCIEANEALGEKDRVMKFRTCRKEAKECELWLRLLDLGENLDRDKVRAELRQEAHELKLICSAIVKKLESLK